MKILFLFCFLLPLSSKATLALRKNGSPCHSALSAIGNNPPQQAGKPIEPRALISSLQRSKSRTLDLKRAAALLPQFNSNQLISLFEAILKLKDHPQTRGLAPPFIEALMTATKERISQFDKDQLVYTLYFYREMGLKPDDDFIHSWRKAALKKQREFESLERYSLSGFFKELGIPPLNNPYDIHSGYRERPFY